MPQPLSSRRQEAEIISNGGDDVDTIFAPNLECDTAIGPKRSPTTHPRRVCLVYLLKKIMLGEVSCV